tara:strand:+ start:192 stop:359 length:168 start_codon:yes stop_codon:yes gene_type:complete
MSDREEYKRVLEENKLLRINIILHGQEMHRQAENAGLTCVVELAGQLLKTLEPRK